MRLFATKWFMRFARSARIADGALREAIDRPSGVWSMAISAAD